VNLKYAEPPHLFRNLGKGKFAEVTKSAGAEFAAARVGRWLRTLMYLMMGARRAAFYEWRPQCIFFEMWLRKILPPPPIAACDQIDWRQKSNRDGNRAVVRVTSSTERKRMMLKSGSSYWRQMNWDDVGLGQLTKADAVEIRWPSGQVDKLLNVNAGQTVTVDGRRRARRRGNGSRK